MFPNLKPKKVLATGELFPRGSMQKRCVRALFNGEWLHRTHGKRWFTLAMCQLVIPELVCMLGHGPTRSPTQGSHEWVDVQAKRLHALVRSAKKSHLRKVHALASLYDMVK